MVQLRISWVLSDGVTVRRQTLPLVTEDLAAIQNIVNEMANLTTRSVDSAVKVKYETVM
jgi:hypothetical protein